MDVLGQEVESHTLDALERSADTYIYSYIFKALRAVRRARFLDFCIIFESFYVHGVSFGVIFAISPSFWELFGNTFCIKNSIGAPRLPQVAPRGEMQI